MNVLKKINSFSYRSHPFEFGASQLRVSPSLLRKLIDKNLVNISPCGAVFVKSIVREGVLPRMLREILDTRLMVKQSMKLHKNDKLLQRILHSRQLGLKLMANVTYGYTAANFSGRMPCVEVGDSVVSKGRETLERAIKMVQKKKKWESNVVYGDTDSLFVLCPGKSREEAFKIGNEIAEAVTNDNPYPVKLKLEKVYQPSILQVKLRRKNLFSLFLSSSVYVRFRRKNAMSVSCMNHLIKRNPLMKPKASKLFAVMVVLPLQK